MRKLGLLPLLALLLALGACSSATGTERRSLIGLWVSSDFPAASLSLTLTEVARNVTGTGRWFAPDRAEGFQILGTHAEQSVSLIFRFAGSADVNFQGQFIEEDVLQGTLVGNGLRGESVTFRRQKEN